ncbi:1-(5-phosphoribosyl)-5-[(5-phosphoribosylamino)methylideneamino] imidazole-4-carboxamide isomerase [Reichenbachiella sp. MALMAid0571]|uniref:1-(5-phosphoribosyl)-5-[(5- phosphoribosylamino)methylideneamino]imidazole-4- carboxamide isomerase n=1 Tax=Reichenbachiella sp. MALMAid0571 TaxID=3143939 RepID=UPI0032DFE998
MLLVPSISILNGKIVRLTGTDHDKETIYKDSPIDLAKKFEDHGIERIHLVDLEGARAGKIINYHILELVAGYTNLDINFTGGLHTDGDITKAFESGAESITASTISVYNKELFKDWIMSYGREKIALGADVLNGNIRVGGWQKETKIDLFSHIDYYYSRGLKYLKTTDISKDGTLEGPSYKLYEEIIKKFPNLHVFASGGVRNIADFEKLNDLGVHGVVFGKAFYENKITLNDIDQFIVKM